MTRYTLKHDGAFVCGMSRRRDYGLVISHDEPGRRQIYATQESARDAADKIEAEHDRRRLTLRGTRRVFRVRISVVPIHVGRTANLDYVIGESTQ